MLWEISLGDDGFRFLAINLKVAEISCYTVLCTPYPGCQQAAPHGGQAWLTNEEWSSIWAGLVAHQVMMVFLLVAFLKNFWNWVIPLLMPFSRRLFYSVGVACHTSAIYRKHTANPIDPHDYHLLGYTWNSQFDFDTVLTMGHELGELLHLLGLEESSAKSCPPSPVMSCLSIELITLDCTLSIDSDRLAEIESLLHSWLHKRTTTKTSLQSLVGKLVFASKCVRQSRVYVARILRLLRKVTLNHNHINLNSEFRKDIQWCCKFLRA